MTLNCNGIRAAYKKGLANFLEIAQADVVCLQEVRASEAQLPAMFGGGNWFSDVACHWFPAQKGGYSGVGVISRLPILQVSCGMGDALFDGEGRVQRIDFKKFTVVNAYFPSGTSGEDRQAEKFRFLDLFFPYIEQVISEQPRTLVVGDFNIAHQAIDLKNWKSNQKTSGFLPEERDWLTRFSELGFQDVVRNLAGPQTEIYSWWSQRSGARERNVGWRLDYQWATKKVAVKSQRFEITRHPLLSDHAPVTVDYQI